jgi:cell division septation protein DedD
MPWQLNGHYYSFTESSIRANVPPISGVYGLYNIKYQVLIGESANIRATLLRHEKETRFGFGPYRPTGFTFEIQSPESRVQRAQELIREYRPVRQAAFTFVRPWKPVKDPAANALTSAATRETHGANHEDRADEPEKKVQSAFFGRYQLLAVALGFTLATVTGVFLGSSTATRNEQMMTFENKEALVKIPGGTLLKDLAPEQKAPLQQDLLAESSESEPMSKEPSKEAKPQEAARVAITKAKPMLQDTTAASASQKAGEKSGSLLAVGKDPRSSRRAKPEELDRRWTVQVKASPDRATAGVWLDRLTDKGYEAFIVDADIRGRTWYRVRVGNFATRQEAEKVRQTLEAEEGFSDAFLAAGNADRSVVSRSR